MTPAETEGSDAVSMTGTEGTDDTSTSELGIGYMVMFFVVIGLIVVVGIPIALTVVVGAMLLVLLAIVAYAIPVGAVNLLLLLGAGLGWIYYWLKTRIDGKAIMKARLEGRIPMAKQRALELGLELKLLDEPGRSGEESEFTRRDIERFKRLVDFDGQSSNDWFTFWLPLLRRDAPIDLSPRMSSGDVEEPDGDVEEPDGDAEKPDGDAEKPDGDARRVEVNTYELYAARRSLGWRLRGLPSAAGSLVKKILPVTEDAGQRFEEFMREKDGVNADPFPPDTHWVYDTMGLLNTAEDSMRRSMGTALEAYLRAKVKIMRGEFKLHKRDEELKEHEYLESEARQILTEAERCDRQTKRVVRDLLCPDKEPEKGSTVEAPTAELADARTRTGARERSPVSRERTRNKTGGGSLDH